jgi:hypothetical protein
MNVGVWCIMCAMLGCRVGMVASRGGGRGGYCVYFIKLSNMGLCVSVNVSFNWRFFLVASIQQPSSSIFYICLMMAHYKG